MSHYGVCDFTGATMLNTLKQFFERRLQPGTHNPQGADRHTLQLATAVLLIEMMRSDYHIKDAERQAVLRAVQAKFELSPEEGADLVQLAEREARQATDYHQFTSLINKGFTAEQKERVIEYLWQVAYADGDLDKYEEHMVRKIAELLYVPHAAYIAAKHRAHEAQQVAGGWLR